MLFTITHVLLPIKGSESLNPRPATIELSSTMSYIKPTMTSRLLSTVSLPPQENSPALLFSIYVLCTAFGGFITGLLVVCVVLLVNQRKKQNHKQSPLKSKNMSDLATVTAGPIYETVVSSTEYKDEVLNSPENKAEKATHSSNGQDFAMAPVFHDYQNIPPQYGRRI